MEFITGTFKKNDTHDNFDVIDQNRIDTISPNLTEEVIGNEYNEKDEILLAHVLLG